MLRTKKYLPGLFLLLCMCLNSYSYAQDANKCDVINEKADKALQNEDFVKSIELFNKVYIQAEKHQWDKQAFNASLGLGNNYFYMLDYGEALKYYLEAYAIAIKKSNTYAEIAVLNNIANLYKNQKMYDKATEYYNKAYDLAVEKKIDGRKGLPLLNLGCIYNELNEPAKARLFIIESMPFLDGNHLTSAKISLIENDMLLGNTEPALKKAIELNKAALGNVKDNYNTTLSIIIAKCYLKLQDFKPAISEATKILKTNNNLDYEIKRNVYSLLSDVYHENKSFNMSLLYRDSVLVAEKKLDEINNRRVFASNRVKFEILNYKNQLAINAEKVATERKIFYSAIALLLVLVAITVLFLRQKKALAERNQHISDLNLEKEKHNSLLLEKQIANALLMQEQLKNEVDVKNRKLSTKAIYLADRNELIEEIVSYLSKDPLLIRDANLVGYVNSLKANLRTDTEWDSFITHFEEVNHGFLKRLKVRHPALSANDIRFIAYIYMNLSVKEISSLLNITTVACKKRKERLAAKMEISKDEDLFSYISNLK